MITKHILYQTCIEFMKETIISSFYKTFQIFDIIYNKQYLSNNMNCVYWKNMFHRYYKDMSHKKLTFVVIN